MIGSDTRSLRRLEGAVAVVVLQVVWFASVLGAAQDFLWLGPSLAVVVSLLYLGYSYSRRRDALLMLFLVAFGAVAESILQATGLMRYRGAVVPWLAPAWILGLWLQFGMLRHGLLRLLVGRPIMAVVLGAVGGPLVYGFGVALGAAEFHPDVWPSLAALAVVWALALPWATRRAWRGSLRATSLAREAASTESSGTQHPFNLPR
ncbi:MAG: DUF2878 domain-containing protein [Acidobacteriota bacterium]